MASKKITEPFGLVTQREWDGLIARGADLDHIGMFALLRVRADRDRITRDTLVTLGKRMNRSDDRASKLIAWLRDAGVVSSERKARQHGSRGSAWVMERRSLELDEWKSTAEIRVSSTKSTADSREEHRIPDRRAPHSLPCNPNVLPDKSQPENAGKAFPTGDVREVGTGRLAEAEALGLARVSQILAKSQHAEAFEGKLNDLADLVLRYPDRDIEKACRDLIEKVPVIKFVSKAITVLESFVDRAPRVAQSTEFTCKECGRRFDYGYVLDRGPICLSCHSDRMFGRTRTRLVPSLDKQLADMRHRDKQPCGPDYCDTCRPLLVAAPGRIG